VNRRRNPDKGWSHRDIGTREIGILEVKRIETSKSRNTGKSGPSVSRDTWWRSHQRRRIEGQTFPRFGIFSHQGNQVPEDKETGHRKSRNPGENRDHPSEKGRVATIDVIGKALTRKRPSVFSSSGYR
jgi:hypothetical protein